MAPPTLAISDVSTFRGTLGATENRLTHVVANLSVTKENLSASESRIALAKEMGGDGVVTKSGLMVGLGETFDEMVEAFAILREHRVQILTVGQYLRPTEQHLPVVRYWHPDEFDALSDAAYELGFESVASGPLVRSSYHADESASEVAERTRSAA